MKRLLVPGWLLVAVGLGCFQPGIALAQEESGGGRGGRRPEL